MLLLFLKKNINVVVVHQVRNTLKYISYKDKKEFASDLKSIYLAATESQALENLEKVSEK
ncbi:MAG: transposase [Fusobacterium periodonticum]|nr:transposase [Fusobacterium periodonticum]